MIGLDTNILLRLLVDDGSRDVQRARGFVAEQAAQGKNFFVDAVVLAEVVWVLESALGYKRYQIAAAVDALLHNAAYVIDQPKAVAAALTAFRSTRADFSDCLIVERHRVFGCGVTATLDKAMKPINQVRVVG